MLQRPTTQKIVVKPPDHHQLAYDSNTPASTPGTTDLSSMPNSTHPVENSSERNVTLNSILREILCCKIEELQLQLEQIPEEYDQISEAEESI